MERDRENNGYIEQYRILYRSGSYAREPWYLPEISLFIEHLKPKSVLDYGCGEGALVAALQKKYPDIIFYGYDPAIAGREALPAFPVDMVLNNDVLEHIPEPLLPDVIAEIASLSQNAVFGLHHALATTTLPNGENAHCTVRPPEWYRELLGEHFPRVVQLPGRYGYLSMATTFSLPSVVIDSYHAIIGKTC